MEPVNDKNYRVIVLFGSTQDGHFDSPVNALVFANAEMRRLGKRKESARTRFDGIYCERQDTRETWRYQRIRGIPMWVLDREAR